MSVLGPSLFNATVYRRVTVITKRLCIYVRMYDNASANNSTTLLDQQVKQLQYHPYTADWSSCNIFPFPVLKNTKSPEASLTVLCISFCASVSAYVSRTGYSVTFRSWISRTRNCILLTGNILKD